MAPYATDRELEDLVARFEAGSLPLAEWHHAEHLAVATWYVRRLPFDAAVAALRAGIQRFNAGHGIVTTPELGYHETVTVYFARRIRAILEAPGAPPAAEGLGAVLAELGDKMTILRHYTRERVMSAEARAGWVEPDLAPLSTPG